MKSPKNIFKIRSLRYQLLAGFLFILTTSIIIIGIYQTLTMKQYLYKSKEMLLESRYRNIPNGRISHIKSSEDVNNNASNFIQQTIDVNITAAIIDNQGNIISSESNLTNNIINDSNESDNTFPKHQIDKKNNIVDDESKVTSDKKLKRENIPVPELGKTKYLSLLHQNGDLEGNSVIKDKNNNPQIVIWRKLGDIHNPYGLIQLSTSAKPEQDILNRQLYVYIVAAIMVLVIGSVLGAVLFNRTLKPLNDMTAEIEQINVGKLNTRLPFNNGQLEIDRLSNAFNDMLKRIEISFENEQIMREKMRHFVSDASHELRTPLTSIHGFVEVLLRGAAKNEQQLYSSLNSILSESERLTKLVNDLLLLNKLDQKSPIEMKKENLNAVIFEIFPQLQILAGERKINLELSDNIYADINKNQIIQVILNLVQNAVNHTDEKEGIITIYTNIKEDTSSNKFIILKISDNGTGISKEHLSEIFDRFFRIDSHRSRKSGGYGLGLSIVKSIVDAHNGKIEVESEVGRGSEFRIYL
ncbi:MAG: HAMP domain-containing sensor histidine kinase [Bacillota bacterium]|nr:HAMP domain-containing sensor histidine kinase [Bacillota bacterium]